MTVKKQLGQLCSRKYNEPSITVIPAAAEVLTEKGKNRMSRDTRPRPGAAEVKPNHSLVPPATKLSR